VDRVAYRVEDVGEALGPGLVGGLVEGLDAVLAQVGDGSVGVLAVDTELEAGAAAQVDREAVQVAPVASLPMPIPEAPRRNVTNVGSPSSGKLKASSKPSRSW